MKCKKIKKLISKYFDHQTNQKETEIIFEHIKVCPLCEKEFRVFSTIYNNLPEYNTSEISSDFNTKLFRRLYQQENIKTSIFESLFNKKLRKIFVPAIGVSLVVLFTTFIFNLQNKTRNFYSSYELYPQEDLDLTMIDFFVGYIE